jgi:hypothetical protein
MWAAKPLEDVSGVKADPPLLGAYQTDPTMFCALVPKWKTADIWEPKNELYLAVREAELALSR